MRDMLTRYENEISPLKRGRRAEGLRIRAFLRDFPDLADRPLSQVVTPDLAVWRDARLRGYIGSNGAKIPGVTAASVLRDINWLRNAFFIARKEWHWIEHNSLDGLKLPATPPPRDRRISPSEVKRLCRWLGYRPGRAPETKCQEVALVFMVALRTAMRAGEILKLGQETLNIRTRVATVEHKMQYKTGKPRQVPLSRHAIRLIAPRSRPRAVFLDHFGHPRRNVSQGPR
ncbi:MAG: tyrosine-type recombinase/integrase [Burkholderia gladioli]